MTPSTSIKIGQHNLSKIECDDIRPGDFICTYEALTTRSDLLAIESLQKLTSLKKRPELNKMFHAEIVLHKYPRSGMYRVAHANGSTKRVVLENDNFKAHHPGQALIIFRAKDEKVQREIVAIANKTAEAGNGHQCKILKLDSPIKRVYYLFRLFIAENLRAISLNKTLKNIAHMVVNFGENGRFYHRDNTGSRAMRCVEYVANVVNAATVRIFSTDLQREVSREEKIQSVFNQIKELNQNYTLPFKLSRTETTPANFVDFFLNNSKYFQTVGYLGEYSEPLDGPALDVKGRTIQISPRILLEILSNNLFSETEIDHIYAAKLMKALGILSNSWKLHLKAAIDPTKIKALCTCIYAKEHNLSLKIDEIKDTEELDRWSNDLLRKIEALANKDSETVHFEELPRIKTLSYEDISQVLLIEKECIKISSSLERVDKTLKLSLNALENQANKIAKTRSFAERMIKYGRMTLKTIFLSPLYLGFSIAGHILNKNARAEEKTCCKKTNDLLVLHEKIRKNGKITLTSDITFEGHRPWAHYSTDNGTTWYQDPFKDQGAFWDINVCVPKGKSITYMLFIGPEDISDPDPIGKAKAWQKANFSEGSTLHNIEAEQEIENSSSVLKIADIFNPCWISERPMQIRSTFVEEY